MKMRRAPQGSSKRSTRTAASRCSRPTVGSFCPSPAPSSSTSRRARLCSRKDGSGGRVLQWMFFEKKVREVEDLKRQAEEQREMVEAGRSQEQRTYGT